MSGLQPHHTRSLQKAKEIMSTPEGRATVKRVKQKFIDEETKARAKITKEVLYIQRYFIRANKFSDLIEKICSDHEDEHHLNDQAMALFKIVEAEGVKVRKNKLNKEIKKDYSDSYAVAYEFKNYLFLFYSDMAGIHQIWSDDTCLLHGV